MIVVGLKGGLGNQMFQYAVGRRLALKLGTNLRLDISFHLHDQGSATPRPYLLDRLNVKGEVIGDRELMDFLDAGLSRYKRGLNRTVLELTGHRTFKSPRVFVESAQSFDRAVLDLPDNRYLSGYFQCERYFVDIRDVLLDDLRVLKEMNKANQEMKGEIADANSVCIHFRRGDYYSNPAARRVHAVNLDDYYKAAIAEMRERIGGCRFFLFSDEPDWVRANFNLGDDCAVVDINSPNEPEQDLRLMSLCKHFIIANSSFSWWGAWLSQSPGKVVIAPKRWFTDDRQTDDRCPASWIRL